MLFLWISLLSILSFSWSFSIVSIGANKQMQRQSRLKMAVTEIFSIAELDAAVSAAGDKLLVVDYSTTWCGPCKLVLPKYLELSTRFDDVVFLKCIGDVAPEASALMKREGVRSVPSFHMWKSGSRVDVINGAKIEEVRSVKNIQRPHK